MMDHILASSLNVGDVFSLHGSPQLFLVRSITKHYDGYCSIQVMYISPGFGPAISNLTVGPQFSVNRVMETRKWFGEAYNSLTKSTTGKLINTSDLVLHPIFKKSGRCESDQKQPIDAIKSWRKTKPSDDYSESRRVLKHE